MVKVPEGYRSKNVQDRRTGRGSMGGGINAGDLLGGMLGGNATGSGSLGGMLAKGALTSILGGLLGGGRSRGGGLLGGMLGGLLGGGGREASEAARHEAHITDDDRENANDEAVILIRAMINAAKADGQIDQEEIKNIVGKLGEEVSEQESAFLNAELRAPLDLEEFCGSVPEDLTEQAYAFSVMGMKLDTQQEAQYLGEVAEGLDLDADTCNAIHDKLGVPKIFA